MLRRNQYLISLAQKLPNKHFRIASFAQKIFQKSLNKKLTISMEKFDYIGFKLALCLGANPNIDSQIQKGYHLVTRCARSGEAELLQLLLDFGAEVNAGEAKGGYLPIHMAAAKGHAPILELLVRYGADIHCVYQLSDNNRVMQDRGWTPLICACRQNKTEAVITLLKLGANPLDKDDLGVGALDIATKYKNKELIQALYPAYRDTPVILKNYC